MIFASPIALLLAYSALLYRYTRSGVIWRIPGFFAYLIAFLVSLIAHGAALAMPPGLGYLPYLEPVLISLKVIAWLEAFTMATVDLAPLERRLFLALLATVSLIAIVIVAGSQPDLYRAVRAYANTALAAASLAGVGWLWIAPIDIRPDVRNHCLILTVYFCNLAVAGFMPASTRAAWITVNALSSAISLLCCWEWWAYGVNRSLVLRTSSISASRLSRTASR